MKIAILGTGGVARILAGALSDQDHEVKLGSRDPAAALAPDVRPPRASALGLRPL